LTGDEALAGAWTLGSGAFGADGFEVRAEVGLGFIELGYPRFI